MRKFLKYLFNPKGIVPKEMVLVDDLPTGKEAVKTTLAVAWPAIVEAFLVSLVSLVDTMMVSSVGTEAIAAVGICGQPRFVLLALFMSLNVGLTAVVARRKGEGNQESANHAMRLSLKLVLIGSIIATGIGIWMSKPFLVFMGAEAKTLELAVVYFDILVAGFFFNTVALVLTAAQRGCGNTKISMRTNLVANLVNVVLNYLLIGGNFGFPQMGVAGAALATIIGQACAMVMAIASVRHKSGFLFLSLKRATYKDPRNMPGIMKIAASSATEQVFIRIGFILFTKTAASLGTVAYATHQICQNFMNLSFSFGDGLSIASSSLVGQNLGRERPDLSLLYANISQRIALIIGCSMTVFFLVTRNYLLLPFTSDPEMIKMGAKIMLVLAFICPGQVSQVIFSAALRVAGDAKYVARTSLICITFVRTSVAWFLCYPMKMGVMGIWFGFFFDQYLRLFLNMTRFSSGKWMKLKI